jgi:four helix bundle protein
MLREEHRTMGDHQLPRSDNPAPFREQTKAYTLRIIRLYGALPSTTEGQVIGKQLLHSGTAVGANYREGTRARSISEMIAKFGICIQELDETAYWLELLVEAGKEERVYVAR